MVHGGGRREHALAHGARSPLRQAPRAGPAGRGANHARASQGPRRDAAIATSRAETVRRHLLTLNP